MNMASDGHNGLGLPTITFRFSVDSGILEVDCLSKSTFLAFRGIWCGGSTEDEDKLTIRLPTACTADLSGPAREILAAACNIRNSRIDPLWKQFRDNPHGWRPLLWNTWFWSYSRCLLPDPVEVDADWRVTWEFVRTPRFPAPTRHVWLGQVRSDALGDADGRLVTIHYRRDLSEASAQREYALPALGLNCFIPSHGVNIIEIERVETARDGGASMADD